MKTWIAGRAIALAALISCVAFPAFAQASGAPPIDNSATAWVLTASALVLFMCLPALALFYGGLVSARNVLSVFTQCAAIASIASLIWLAFGYSLAFSDGGSVNALIGGLGKAMLSGVDTTTQVGRLPETAFFLFQLTFAAITPALILGAYPERMSFGPVLAFNALWAVLVYAPVTHWIWGGGWLGAFGTLDFAGGIVVHTTAGVSALALAIMLGPRRGFPREVRPPHSPGMTYGGAAMLWVGWFGFNGGSALAADGAAAMAILVTHTAAAAASMTWMAIEWVRFGRPSMVGLVTGTIAGLATVTPAAGFIGPWGGLACGVAGAAMCFEAVQIVKVRMKIDDSLDVFAVHGVGGMLGSLLLPLLALPGFGGLGLKEGITAGHQFVAQLAGVGAVALWSLVVTIAIVKAISAMAPLRVDAQDEIEGLDLTVHGERAYEL
jgi:Amt family ammonium transporter